MFLIKSYAISFKLKFCKKKSFLPWSLSCTHSDFPLLTKSRIQGITKQPCLIPNIFSPSRPQSILFLLHFIVEMVWEYSCHLPYSFSLLIHKNPVFKSCQCGSGMCPNLLSLPFKISHSDLSTYILCGTLAIHSCGHLF